MEEIRMYVSYITPILTIICSFLIFLKNKIKKKQVSKMVEKTEELMKRIIPYIEEAERFTNFSGEEKKEYVMTKLKGYAINFGIDFDENSISNKVEELIELSKKVNTFKDENKESIENRIKKIIGGIKDEVNR